jgi:hypothetical protein
LNLGILGTQLQFQFVIGFFETFLVDGKFKGLSNKPLTRKILTVFAKVMMISFFPFK